MIWRNHGWPRGGPARRSSPSRSGHQQPVRSIAAPIRAEQTAAIGIGDPILYGADRLTGHARYQCLFSAALAQ
ncbi:MAG: hypothetical protein WCZ02_10175 [Lysobacterales bacterium]